ncbi:Nacht, Lrr And Pyd Domains-Containing Protein 9 [Manis pentadactyla]|nr:Nacht, Lrr And Pyd Domains-Containing Protein 9 [Manis pentadactyla]
MTLGQSPPWLRAQVQVGGNEAGRQPAVPEGRQSGFHLLQLLICQPSLDETSAMFAFLRETQDDPNPPEASEGCSR